MSKTSKPPRNKRSQLVINLVETAAGYSIIQGTQLLNKVLTPPPQASNPPQTNLGGSSTVVNPPIIKQQKLVTKQKNMLFLSGPTQFNHKKSAEKVSIKTPLQGKMIAGWLDLNEVHAIQRNQIKLWMLQNSDEGNLVQIDEDSSQFKDTLQKYRRDRNKIVTTFYERYWPNKQFMSASKVRKFISDDAYWIMKIHIFLTNWGIINRNHVNLENQLFNPGQVLQAFPQKKFKENQQRKEEIQRRRKNMEDNSHEETEKILNFITEQLRPNCDFCGIKCSTSWFQHIRNVDIKEIQTIMKNVNSKNPPLSEKAYQIILCTNCFCNGSFPLLLTHQDFKKVTVNDKLEPNRKKKKEKKNKKKDKKKRHKNKERMIEDEQAEQEQKEEEHDGQKQDDQKEKDEKDQKEEISCLEKQISSRREKKRNQKIEHNEEQANDGSNQVINQEPQEQQIFNSAQIISEVINKLKVKSQLSLEEIELLLNLIEQHGQNWQKIYAIMTEKGHCNQFSVENLIQSFVLLPKIFHEFELKEDYEEEVFVSKNSQCMHSTKLLQKKIIHDLQQVQSQCGKTKEPLEQFINSSGYQESRQQLFKNKQLLDSFLRKTMYKIDQRVQILEMVWNKSKSCAISSDRKIKGICD